MYCYAKRTLKALRFQSLMMNRRPLVILLLLDHSLLGI